MFDEWVRLESFVSRCTGVPVCFGAGLVVQLVGDSVVTACKGDFKVPFDKVLVRISHADWTMVKWCKGPLKVLRASGFGGKDDSHVLDLTGVATCMVAQAPIEEATCISVAEFFAGGFLGWSHASYALRHTGAPLQVKWTLDIEPACAQAQQCVYPHSEVVRDTTGLSQALQHQRFPMLLQTDVREPWWQAAFLGTDVQVAFLSAPCQPWSSAGRGAGLSSADGRLLLDMASILGEVRHPCCCH